MRTPQRKMHSTHILALQNPSMYLTARNQAVCQASNEAVQVRDTWGVTGAAAEAKDLCGDYGHQGLGVGSCHTKLTDIYHRTPRAYALQKTGKMQDA